MTKRKRWAVICGILSLCMFGYKQSAIKIAIASPLIPPVVSSNIQEVNNIHSLYSKTNYPYTYQYGQTVTLDNFMDDVIRNKEINNIYVPKDTNNILKTDLLLKKDEFINNKSIALEEHSSGDKVKIKKMQKLASYISQNYKVSLLNAEKIVFSVFSEAAKKDLEPILVLSMISIESTFDQYSRSKAGAIGLTQVMPKVHRHRIAENKVDIWSVHGNIKIGTDIFKDYLHLTGGNIKNALQRYNGSSNDKKFRYSNEVMNRMQTFKVAAN